MTLKAVFQEVASDSLRWFQPWAGAELSAEIIVDFYTVDISPSEEAFSKVLRRCAALPDDESRTREVSGRPVRLETVKCANQRASGDLVRIRMSELPAKARLDSPSEELDLDDDEGIGEKTCFLYRWESQAPGVLMLQRNRRSVTASAFANFFTSIDDNLFSLHLEPILRVDVLQRVAEMTEVRTFEIAMKDPDSTIFSGIDALLGGSLNLLEAANSANISIRLSLGHGRPHDSLDRGWLRRMMDRVFGSGEPPREISKLRVRGRNAETAEIEALDLLNARIAVPVEVEGDSRTLSFDDRYRALQSAWRIAGPEVREVLGRP